MNIECAVLKVVYKDLKDNITLHIVNICEK